MHRENMWIHDDYFCCSTKKAREGYRDDPEKSNNPGFFFFQSLTSLSCSFSPYMPTELTPTFSTFFWFGFTIYMFLFLVKEIPNEKGKADQRRFEMLNSCIPLAHASPYPNSVGIFFIEASPRDSRKVPTPPPESTIEEHGLLKVNLAPAEPSLLPVLDSRTAFVIWPQSRKHSALSRADGEESVYEHYNFSLCRSQHWELAVTYI